MLTLEQKREVAEAVTGVRHYAYRGFDGENIISTLTQDEYITTNTLKSQATIWFPSFGGIAYFRSQALKIIEFISKQVDDLRTSCYEEDLAQATWAIWGMGEAIANNDVDALEALVWELIKHD